MLKPLSPAQGAEYLTQFAYKQKVQKPPPNTSAPLFPFTDYWSLLTCGLDTFLAKERLETTRPPNYQLPISNYFFALSFAAFSRPTNSGCGRMGRDKNSGWN